jgi:uncharacterized protein (DUF305 family)
MKFAIGLLVLLFTIVAPVAASAQTAPAPAPAMDHSKMDHSKMGQTAPSATDSASTKAFKEANDRMHAEMGIPFTGNADVDFVKGMLPHHQGAVDMARIVLKHGKDPAVRKLAREIIKAQDVEIAFMKKWLAADAKKSAQKAALTTDKKAN